MAMSVNETDATARRAEGRRDPKERWVGGTRIIGRSDVVKAVAAFLEAGGQGRGRPAPGVVLCDPDREPDDVLDRAVAWSAHGADVWILSEAFSILPRRANAPTVAGYPVLHLPAMTNVCVRRRLARVVDVLGALAGLLVLSPLFVLLAPAIALTSRGPVLHRQTRVGMGGRPFTLYKFRSMVAGADAHAHERMAERWARGHPTVHTPEGDASFKPTDDPRVTRVGKWIRRTSVDELPQLWNVLRGDMSLVGPRPGTPFELDLYKPWHRFRLTVLPGCTGLWQVTARSRVGLDDMVLLDLHYIARRSLWANLRLVFRTVPVMLAGRGGA